MTDITCEICKELKSEDLFPKSKKQLNKPKRKSRLTHRVCKECRRLRQNKSRRNKNFKKSQDKLLSEFGTIDLIEIKEIRRIRANAKKREDYYTKYKFVQKRRVKDWISRNKDKHKAYCKKSKQKAYNKLVEKLNQTYGNS